MRTWLQPVQFRSGPAGKPRRVHYRRVELDGRTVTGVSQVTLCGISGVIPAGADVTCRQCQRLAGEYENDREEEQA